jgi:tetratricopeptide (TPR) repeat protein
VADGRFREAIPLLRAAVAGDPDNTDARLLYARVLSWVREYDASLAEYRIVLEKRPGDPRALSGYARVLAWSGRYDESLREFRLAIAADPGNLETRVGYARALSWSGDLAGASHEYERILAEDPDQGDAWLGLASVARWRGAPAAADRFVTRAGDLGADPEGVADEERAVRQALGPSVGGGYTAYSEVEYVSGPNFVIKASGPYAQASATVRRAAGIVGRVGWIALEEIPSDSDTLDYDLTTVDYRVDAAYKRGYPWQAAAGFEYQTFESTGVLVRYPLTSDDDFVGWSARVWRFTDRVTPRASARRSFLPLKLVDPSNGARYFDPGHVDDYEAGVAWQWSGRGSADGFVAPGFYSDGNERSTVSGSVAYRIQASVPYVSVDGSLTYADWLFQSPNYFTPLNSLRATAGLAVSGYAGRPAADYGFRYRVSRITSSNFDDITTHAWSGYANVTAAGMVPLGVEASYSIDNHSYETWFLGLSGSLRW